MRICLYLLLVNCLAAAETRPIVVDGVIDGLAMRVLADVGGVPVPVAVHLPFIRLLDTDEDLKVVPAPSTSALLSLVPPGGKVILAFGEGSIQYRQTEHDMVAIPIVEIVEQGKRFRKCVLTEMVRSGWAAPDFSDVKLPEQLKEELKKALEDARENHRGSWH